MSYTQQNQDKVHEDYLEIPCANCGMHYWKIPFKKCDMDLKCPQCQKATTIYIGETLKVHRN